MELTKKQFKIMAADGHLLVTGGPGSGKTTVSILKAAQLAERALRPGQKVLFLSFARATVSRVVEAIEYEQQVPRELKRRIDVETYHSFFWRILKAHGYLVGLPRGIRTLTPPEEAVALSGLRNSYPATSRLDNVQAAEKVAAENVERVRLAREEGRVCFDLFAPLVGDILTGSARIRKLLATMHPAIVLDEFQDTNAEQWRVVHALGEFTTLIALADPEQRIYDFIGADPERLTQLCRAFAPTEVDLSTDNHRSPDTDIAAFGNDILKGEFRQEAYTGVRCVTFASNADQAFSSLVTSTYKARARLVNEGITDWSLAVLVPTKRMTRQVSDAFRSPPASMKEIPHLAAIDLEATILGAEVLAVLMQPGADDRHFEHFIMLVVNYFRGKGGDNPSKTALDEADGIQKAYDAYVTGGRVLRKNSRLVAMRDAYEQARKLDKTGDPNEDWTAIRSLFEDCGCKRLQEIAQETRNIRLLARGTQLRQSLAQDWRDNGTYRNALTIIRQAFVQEHFATNAKPESGVVVMNMHKAKGKQFDEVIIFEGWPIMQWGKIVHNPDRIVRFNARDSANEQARQNLRVSVTRARRRTTILTPVNDPCVLLLSDDDTS